jgi:bifunctional DNA-binding transcriptional regulator/antitoxin component of YhaV-PrlF toxin-antitoxin module
MLTIKLTAKRQATFPAEVCEALGVKPGDRIELEARTQGKGRVWVLKPVTSKARPWFGVLGRYARKSARPWSRERDGDATGRAWAKESAK